MGLPSRRRLRLVERSAYEGHGEVPEVLSSKYNSGPNAFELTAESYVDCEQPIVILDVHPLEITHGNKTASNLNEGFDRVNPLNEALHRGRPVLRLL
jgi:hypothetical protein